MLLDIANPHPQAGSQFGGAVSGIGANLIVGAPFNNTAGTGAGIGSMRYARFFAYNVIGGVAWVAICLFSGWFFGDLPWVQRHFEAVVIATQPTLPFLAHAVEAHLPAVALQ